MGLDITAYSNATYLHSDPELITEDVCDDYENFNLAWAYGTFPKSTRGLANHDVVTHHFIEEDYGELAYGLYDISESKSAKFHAGTYSGYNIWRQTLADFSGIGNGYACVENPDAYSWKPFYELVWFSDCEGCIGPEAAADLLADFRELNYEYKRWLILNRPDAAEYHLEKYLIWTAAFELAADGGMVDFS